MTPSQLLTLKAAMLAALALAPAIATGDDQAIADYFNAPANPAVIVFKTEIGPDEYGGSSPASLIAGDAFDNIPTDRFNQWSFWTGNGTQPLNPSNPAIRVMIDNTFGGAHPSVQATRENFHGAWKREANRVEALFAVGDGTDSDPAVMTWEGPISAVDASQARVYGD
jgi:hypothetical protein